MDRAWMLDRLPVGVLVARAPGGQVEYANEAFQEILGVAALSGSPVQDVPATYGMFDRAGQAYPVEKLAFSRALAQREPVTVDDIVIHRPDGRRVNVRAFGVPVFDSAGAVTHVIVAFTDTTKEVEAERTRETMQAHLALAINHAPIAIWSAGKDGIVLMSEGAGLASMGVKPGQLVGQDMFALFRDHPTIPHDNRRALAGESFWTTAEVPGAIYDTYMTPLRDSTGAIIGIMGLSNDVTELRRLQAHAIQNDRVIALGTLAASVAHEINNPLSYLLAHAEMCEKNLSQLELALDSTTDSTVHKVRALTKQARSNLEPVRGAAERVARITRQLKTLSRSPEEHRQPIDMRSVVFSVVELVGKRAESCAQLRLELGTAHVVADEARLVQVVLNLVVNAMHAVRGQPPADAEILIRARSMGDRVALDVEDSGSGVPACDRERIFEPFYSTKRPGEGTGLGLFVCRNIVRGLGGEITVEDRPSGGARFRVTLPRLDGPVPTASSVPPRSDPKPEKRSRILLVDDEPSVVHAFAKCLRLEGHEVESAGDGARALEVLLSGQPFDLIFCDLMMRGLTGMDLERALIERAPQRLSRIVFMSGGAYTPEARAFLEAHRAQTVDKPFDIVREVSTRLRRLRQGSSN
jgi:two-component system, cell cycle sensor histidine kinase and response regulator CckA